MREAARRRQRRDHVALLDGAAVDAADEGTYVGGSAASEYRNVDASCHGNVSAGPSALAPEGDGRPSWSRGGWSLTGLTPTRGLVGPGVACGGRDWPSSPGAGSCPLGADIHKRPRRTAV